jgi:hypothetical protein
MSKGRLGISLMVAMAGCSSASSNVEGGAGTGGSGGTGADAPGGSPCGLAEMEPNDTRDNAIPYTAGTDVIACLGSTNDVDFYEVTAPTTDLAGGYYQGSLTNVGATDVQAQVYTARDNSLVLDNNYNIDQGGSLSFYWAAAPGEKYRVAVTKFAVLNQPARYTFKAVYGKVDDTFEPNDMRETAKALTVGAPVMAFFFTGFRAKDIKPEEYQDWFSLTLAAGATTIKIDNVATDVRPQVKLLDPLGEAVVVSDDYNMTPGGSLNAKATIVTPGSYRLVIDIFAVQPEAANKGMVPDSFKRPYTLTVSQP